MYEAAINYMKQSSPVATAKLPPTDEDMFGQYVASQLKLLDCKTQLHIKVQLNNLFLNEQFNEMENVIPLNQQFNVPNFQRAQPQLQDTNLWQLEPSDLSAQYLTCLIL